MIRTALFFMLLSLAAVSDMRKRIVPDWMSFMMAGISLIPPGTVHLPGLLAALPLFVAGKLQAVSAEEISSWLVPADW